MQKLVSDVFQGAYKSRFKGRGMEFEEVRDYLPGDDIRTIDWNVTARMNAPFIKTFKEERELTVMLLVDISRSSLYGTSNKSKKEIIAEIGALLAFSAIKNSDKIGLILFSDEIELYVPPKKGTRHVLRLIRELLAREAHGKGTNLKKALSFMGKVTNRSTICFLISDFITEGYENELKLTALRHDLIGIRVYDQKELSFPALGLAEITDLESGAKKIIDTGNLRFQKQFLENASLNTENIKKTFSRLGAPLIDIDCAQDYLKPIEKSFKSRAAIR